MSLRKIPQRYVPAERNYPVRFKPAPKDFTLKELETGGYGPTGIYGTRVPRSDLLNLFRCAVKPARIWRIEQALLQRCTNVTVCLENLVDPANGSACMRTCEGLGMSEVHVVESYEPFRTSTGITMNADKWLAAHRYRHCMDAVNSLKRAGFTLIATCLDEDAVPLDDVDFTSLNKVAVLLGNEERGLSLAMRENADMKVCIPMTGFSQSLNISTACGIFVHHLRYLGILRPNLTDEEMTELYTKWIIQSTKNAAKLLEKHGYTDEIRDFV